jgi:hypothetical protein
MSPAMRYGQCDVFADVCIFMRIHIKAELVEIKSYSTVVEYHVMMIYGCE